MNEQIIIEKKNRLSANNVGGVGAYNDKEVRVVLLDGGSMTIRGNDLKILSFSKETGAFLIEGKLTDIKFNKKREQFFKRVFK